MRTRQMELLTSSLATGKIGIAIDAVTDQGMTSLRRRSNPYLCHFIAFIAFYGLVDFYISDRSRSKLIQHCILFVNTLANVSKMSIAIDKAEVCQSHKDFLSNLTSVLDRRACSRMLLLWCVARSDILDDQLVLNAHKGIFTPLFIAALWVLFNKSTKGPNRLLFLIVCSMYLLATTVSSGYCQVTTGCVTKCVSYFSICLLTCTVQ
jgi:hypothetical protein